MIFLSPSSLGTFENCPRCFWKEKNEKSPRPRGIFPSLPGGMDAKLKTYFDGFRVNGKFPLALNDASTDGFHLYHDVEQLNKWRNWRSGLSVTTPKWKLGGAIDDLLFNPTAGVYAPLDYKTKGSPANQEDSEKYYQRQLDLYSLMFDGNKFESAGFGILSYWWPLRVGDGALIDFETRVFRISTDINRAKDLCERAAACLEGKVPAPSQECEYCKFVEARRS